MAASAGADNSRDTGGPNSDPAVSPPDMPCDPHRRQLWTGLGWGASRSGPIYASSAERTAALDGWLWTYNHRRPHGALSHKPPIARLDELNNLLGSYS